MYIQRFHVITAGRTNCSYSTSIAQLQSSPPSEVLLLLLVTQASINTNTACWFQDLEDIIAASGYLGPLIFAGSYAAATVLLFPASLLTLGAGYLFGKLHMLTWRK
jgi:hypothetical protein